MNAVGKGPDLHADFIVIGAGIAGASIAYWLSRQGKVIVLEREGHAGYHSTGRSAALFWESYGPPQARAFTCASRAFLENPPPGFCQYPLLTPRAALVFAHAGQEELLHHHERVLGATSPGVQRLTPGETIERVPVIRSPGLIGALLEPGAQDIDVDGLLQGFLRGVRKGGGHIEFDAEVVAMQRLGKLWHVRASDRHCSAPIVVNAAGAWADHVALLAGAKQIGLVPKRRSVLSFAAPPHVAIAGWPMFTDVAQTFYVKPDAGMLLGSPCNEDPVVPHDVQAEELDIAIAIDAIERRTTLTVRPRHVWAGLRSFVEDGDLVGGFDDDVPGLFWAAAQGGYGIQTAAAAGEAYAAIIAAQLLPAHLQGFGLDLRDVHPSRLQTRRPPAA